MGHGPVSHTSNRNNQKPDYRDRQECQERRCQVKGVQDTLAG